MKTTKRGRPFLKVNAFAIDLSTAIHRNTTPSTGHSRPLRDLNRIPTTNTTQAILQNFSQLFFNVRLPHYSHTDITHVPSTVMKPPRTLPPSSFRSQIVGRIPENPHESLRQLPRRHFP